MPTFRTRLSRRSRASGRIILANDYDHTVLPASLKKHTMKNIRTLHPFLCAIKLNFHLLLPLGEKEISKINYTAHEYGLQVIADIKLNDIGNTNQITTQRLWDMGFDAVIANPIMGPESLKKLTASAHKQQHGIISLCHMSAPEARIAYDLKIVQGGRQHLYQMFLDWALSSRVDGIIVGATFPDIIRYCAEKSQKKLSIFSPGVGAQGGDPSRTISSGSDYLIVGRSILNDVNPKSALDGLHTTITT